jgi:DNA-binding transcriptional LysR family regulator
VRSENVGPQGKFSITAPVDIGNAVLPSLAASFLRKYPKIELGIVMSDLNVNFLGDNIDLAIRAGGLKDSSLIAKKVGEVGFKLYSSPKYLKEKGTPENLNELKNHTGIFFIPLWNDGWTLKNEKKSYQVKTVTKITVNNMKLTHGLAMDGAGIALLPSFLCEADIRAGKLINILQDFKSETAPLHFVYPAQKFVPPTVKAFIDFSTELLKDKFHFKN